MLTAVDYPLAPGDTWSETTDMLAKDLEIPGLGRMPLPIPANGVKAETKVSLETISVPAGTFDTLLVETTYDGSLLGIPMTLVQRTWLSEGNITIKRNIEFLKPTEVPLYDFELSKLPPSSVSRRGKAITTWASIKTEY